MNDTTNPEATVSEDGAAMIALSERVKETFEDLFSVVFAEEWKSYHLADQKLVREVLATMVNAGNILREKFDGDVWKGHADGTVSPEVESIRKQREGDTPGKKAKVLTPAEILAKRLAK